MLIDIDKIIIKDRIRKDYGNIEELATDIRDNGLINPPVVTPEYELIAGERRTRACKYLDYKQIEVRVMTVQDALHKLKLEISENENRKDFSYSEKMQWAEQLREEYSKIAKENQLSGLKKGDIPSDKILSNEKIDTNKQIANDVGFNNKESYRQAQYIWSNADEEMIKQLDEGKLSINKAYNNLKEKLKEKDEENKKLQNQLELEQNKPKEKEYIEKIVDNTDYTLQSKLNKIENELREKTKEANRLSQKLDIMTERAEIYEENSNEYKNLQRQIEVLSKEKDDIGKAVRSGTELSGLIFKIENFLKTELCPITYSRAILDMSSNETVMNNLREIIEVVEDWCGDMRKYLISNNKNIIIDVEEN